MRIGIDAMGGDRAPVEEVKGAVSARNLLGPDDRIVLVGRREAILEQLAGADGWQDFIEIEPASQVVTMHDSPVEALRQKPDSSIGCLTQLAAAGALDACISAGNTGAFVAAAQMRLRRLRGVHRPGIAIITPTFHGPVAICDVGANVQCRPQHLHQYGVMASVYVSALCGIENPRVAILNIGAEDTKGNSLVKQTRELFQGDPHVHYVGNAEGRDLFRGVCDVMVCDGFVGNVVLKLMEGMADGILQGVLEELGAAWPQQVSSIRRALGGMLAKYDFNEYGGAPLLGVGGICIICHGASSHRGIMNAVRVTKEFTRYQVNEQITRLLSESPGAVHG